MSEFLLYLKEILNIFRHFFMKHDNIFVYNIMHFNNNTHIRDSLD